jgi:uncharacterized membrane protein (TIGR02234 family)
MRDRFEFGLALLLQLIGAAGALLVATRSWQTVTTPRPRPFRDDVLQLSGRTVDAAPTALALVALAGVIAVIATRGWARRLVGAVVAVAGVLLVWRSLDGLSAVSQERARAFVADKHSAVELGSVARIAVHGAWAWLSAVCGVVIVGAGLLTVWRGQKWRAMGAKYERAAAVDDEQARQRANASLWTALERGEDPTSHGESHGYGPGGESDNAPRPD